MSVNRSPPQEVPAPPADRLESWKEIAAYLRRGVRTVRRWEKEEGLPVHRHVHKKLGTVYAHRSELDAWWNDPGRAARAPGDAPPDQRRSRSTRVTIAVLPFENLGRDPQKDYFADGLSEEMISQLGRIQPETLGVIASTTMMQYKGKTTTAREIGKELAVDYMLEGSVRCEGDRVRVTARLIDVHDQTHLWAGSHEHSIRTILGLQRELAADISREIRLKLTPRQRAALESPSAVTPGAYHAHLKGRHLLNEFTSESVQRSVEYFQSAIDMDPAYAPPYASLAEAYERFPMWIDAPAAQTFPLALAAAEKALRLDPDLPDAYASLGLIHANYLWDWPTAEGHFQRALELNPGCSPARQWYAEFLAEMGRIDEALLIIERAVVNDPLSSVVQSTRAFALWLGRRFDEAIAQAEQVLEIDQGYPMALIRLGFAYAAKEMHGEAVGAFERARKATPRLLDCLGFLAYANGRAGNRRKAFKYLDELRSLARTRYIPSFLFAVAHLGLGDQDESIRFMEKEYDARGWYLLLIKEAPTFDPLREHPRFQTLVRRMNFPT